MHTYVHSRSKVKNSDNSVVGLLHCQDWMLMLLCNITKLALLHHCVIFVSEITSPMPSIQRCSF